MQRVVTLIECFTEGIAMNGLMIGIAWALMMGATTQAQVAKLAGAAHPRVVLVELFTSEGCSSCPSADALLRQINGTRPSADQLIVGISEHVTYWNQLGWSDPFSSQVYTARQNAYGSSFDLDSVYTPQMVVNGTEQFVGSDKNKLADAIRKEHDRAFPVALQILSSHVDGNSLSVSFSASGDVKHGVVLYAVLADDVDQSNVLRGENQGRTLAHVAVARALVRVGRLQTGEQQTVKIALPASIKAAAGHHLILFAQADGNLRILGADSRAL
jgi:hypothetical protein